MKDLYRLLLVLFFVMCASFPAKASLNLILPTTNENLYEHPEEFYMKTARSGADAWKGGMYGFSRNAKRLAAGTVNTRFHEGVDIAPMMRDSRGNPLDSVVAIDEGTVVYVNAVAGRSNYGKYIVVRHIWNGSPFYSLYAHLNETWVEAGQAVRQGDLLGRLGFTGAGINRARAHLHFEIGMLVNEYFQKWYDNEYGDGKNHHSYYNGMNFAGMDVAALYSQLQAKPDLTIREFLRTHHRPFYTVRLPREGRLDILARYPWLLKKSAVPSDPSWEISFDHSGLPLAIVPSRKQVSEPTLVSIQESPFPYKYVTKYRVQGSGSKGSLSSSGARFIRLVATEPDSSTLAEGLIADAEAVESYAWPGTTGAEEADHTGDIPEEGMDGEEPVEEAPTREETTMDDDTPEEMTETSQEAVEETGGSDSDIEDTSDDSALRSSLHKDGYAFSWNITSERTRIAMQPVVLATDDGEGVASIMARCDECARYGISQPRISQIDATSWSIALDVTNKTRLASRARELNGKEFRIELYIKADGKESVSSVMMRTNVHQEPGKPLFAPDSDK